METVVLYIPRSMIEVFVDNGVIVVDPLVDGDFVEANGDWTETLFRLSREQDLIGIPWDGDLAYSAELPFVVISEYTGANDLYNNKTGLALNEDQVENVLDDWPLVLALLKAKGLVKKAKWVPGLAGLSGQATKIV